MNKVLHGDSLDVLKTLEDESVDLLCTDPPYGYSFMGKAWDKVLPDIGIFKECLRVLKPGAFAFVMSAPRSDVCSRMAILLEDAGFTISFTPIYWTYASGFPKAMNIGKMVDKRNGRQFDPALKEYLNERRKLVGLSLNHVNEALGVATNGGGVASALMGDKPFNEIPTLAVYRQLKSILNLDTRFDELIEREEAEREVLLEKSRKPVNDGTGLDYGTYGMDASVTAPATDAAKALNGSYGGFQPKPAVEVVIVAMKPLSEKTYVDQALKNGKGITWLDDVRIPLNGEKTQPFAYKDTPKVYGKYAERDEQREQDVRGRFPANLLVSDDVLNEHSRFFSLDEWANTLPFLAVPKASKREKNEGLEHLPQREMAHSTNMKCANCGLPVLSGTSASCQCEEKREIRQKAQNFHPTVKPLKLMSYLITLGSRPGDVVLDPFLGSGTTCIAAKQLGRQYIGIEREQEYHEIAEARLAAVAPTLI